jgi:hypothetical protein
MPWFDVTSDDVEGRYQTLTAGQTRIVDTIIQDAEDILETAAESAGGAPPPADSRGARAYVRIVSNMVIRVFKNPDALLQETIDDYTYRRDSAISAGLLYVSDDELEQLRPLGAPRRKGAFSITLGNSR